MRIVTVFQSVKNGSVILPGSVSIQILLISKVSDMAVSPRNKWNYECWIWKREKKIKSLGGKKMRARILL